MTDKLRRRAELLAKANVAPTEGALSPEETRQTLHELQVHQIELEMQNEELRRIQAELEAVRARYFDLYDLAPVGYVTIGMQGLILEANFTASTLLGLNRGDLVNQPITRFIFKEDQARYYLHRKQPPATGETKSLELRMTKYDGTVFWANLAAITAKETDGVEVSRVVISDITVRKNAEDLHKHIDRIIQHDLRSPAGNAVTAATVLLAAENLTEEQRSILNLMKDAGQEMIDTLNRALIIYKIETGQYQGVSQPFNCLPMIYKIVDNLHQIAIRKRTQLKIWVNGAIPDPNTICSCLGEPKLLQAAMQNLLQNAVEASSEGKEVSVNMVYNSGLCIEIINNGAVPVEIRNRFFDRYATSGKKFGTGLGNYSAKMLIEAHGGSLEMKTSDEKNETVVTVHLPV